MNCSEIDQAAEADNMMAEYCEELDYLETLIEEVVATLKVDNDFWKIRLHFEKKLIYYLREETTESTTIDAVCTWIEVSENAL
jgi:hypothetical protein